jgi:hypothetical protein
MRFGDRTLAQARLGQPEQQQDADHDNCDQPENSVRISHAGPAQTLRSRAR